MIETFEIYVLFACYFWRYIISIYWFHLPVCAKYITKWRVFQIELRNLNFLVHQVFCFVAWYFLEVSWIWKFQFRGRNLFGFVGLLGFEVLHNLIKLRNIVFAKFPRRQNLAFVRYLWQLDATFFLNFYFRALANLFFILFLNDFLSEFDCRFLNLYFWTNHDFLILIDGVLL